MEGWLEEHDFFSLKHFHVGLGVLPVCVSVHRGRAWCLSRLEQDTKFLRTTVTDGCERPCWYWKSILGPLGEQLVF